MKRRSRTVALSERWSPTAGRLSCAEERRAVRVCLGGRILRDTRKDSAAALVAAVRKPTVRDAPNRRGAQAGFAFCLQNIFPD